MKTKMGLGLLFSSGLSVEEQLKIYKNVGFEAFFSDYAPGRAEICRRAADELGLVYQSIHAPFLRMRHMWEESPETELARQELFNCLNECKKYDVPIMVVHPYIGFDKNTPTHLGIKNFRDVVDRAVEYGVKVAFENVEGDAYLEALMLEFKNYDNVGFCWDAGHEMCYNRHKDMLSLYGDRLICTHINDNIGVTGEEITFLDDLHFIPFDGIKDWEDAMERLKKSGYCDILTFELKLSKAQDDKYGTDYTKIPFEEYVKRVYERASRLREMVSSDKAQVGEEIK